MGREDIEQRNLTIVVPVVAATIVDVVDVVEG
jgi:hypothetical protein